MKTNYLVLIQSDTQYHICKENKMETFLLPLQNFCVGYPKEYSLEEIASFGDCYILINRILDHQAICALEDIFAHIPKEVKGICYEDVGVLSLGKKMGLEIPFYAFTSHFGTSKKELDFWINHGVSGVHISNELTKDEIMEITREYKDHAIVTLFGRNQVLYSRRLLVSNYEKHFKLPFKNPIYLEEEISHRHFIAYENAYGTVFYHAPIYNALSLELPSILFYLVDLVMIDDETVKKLMHAIANHETIIDDSDEGFLHTKTIYKIKELPKDE